MAKPLGPAANLGGIDIFTGGRPGATPTHVTTRISSTPGTRQSLPALQQAATGKPKTVDPFAAFGRAFRGFAKRAGTKR